MKILLICRMNVWVTYPKKVKKIGEGWHSSESKFTDLGLCMGWIKVKQIKHNKKRATRSTLLEIIHTDICGPFNVPSFGVDNFIDDFIVMVISIYFMKNLNQWIPLRCT